MSMGKLKVSNPNAIVGSIIGFAVIGLLLVALLPTIMGVFDNVAAVPNLPFASFFATGGVMFIVLGAFVLLLFIGFLNLGGSKK